MIETLDFVCWVKTSGSKLTLFTGTQNLTDLIPSRHFYQHVLSSMLRGSFHWLPRIQKFVGALFVFTVNKPVNNEYLLEGCDRPERPNRNRWVGNHFQLYKSEKQTNKKKLLPLFGFSIQVSVFIAQTNNSKGGFTNFYFVWINKNPHSLLNYYHYIKLSLAIKILLWSLCLRETFQGKITENVFFYLIFLRF